MIKIIALCPTSALLQDERNEIRVAMRPTGTFDVAFHPRGNSIERKIWFSASKSWADRNDGQTEPPRGWNDAHWAAVDKALEAMKNFNNLYNKE